MSKPVCMISCESPEEWIWDQYLFFENEVLARKFLKEKYSQQGIEQADRMAFKNGSAFTSYIRQAKTIFSPHQQMNLWVQPLLLYYGMMSLLKALILTLDTNYPQNTSVLRHGLSTRKRKKEHYQFFQDEIRIQKDGLFPLVAQWLQPEMELAPSYTAQELLSMIPELQFSYQSIFSTSSLLPILLKSSKKDQSDEAGMTFFVPEKVLDLWHLTSNAFVDRLNRICGKPLFQLDLSHHERGYLSLIWKHEHVSHVNEWEKGFDHPWFYENSKGDYYLWLGNNRLQQPLKEILALHMLLFSLSMLCRYDTPLWGEVMDVTTTEDAILVQQLLTLVRRKFPHLILQAIREEKIILQIH